MRILALTSLVVALPPFHSAIRPLAPAERATLIALVNAVASLIIFGALALFYAISSSFFGRDE